MAISRRAALRGLCGFGVGAAAFASGFPLPAAADAAAAARPYFAAADWLWQPVPDGPVLDPQSEQIVSFLRQNKHVAALRAFGVAIRGPQGVISSTPRYKIKFSNTPAWGPDPFGTDTMPIPNDMPIPSGSDAHVTVADPTRNTAYGLWQARKSRNTWTASWGAKVPLNGDGRETGGTSSTGARLARLAGVVRASEIAARNIPHALFFSTDMAALSSQFRYPASRSDGANMAGVSAPIPEGARVQLDPAVDLSSIAGITPFELTVGRALQTYGAYCGDNGGSRMTFLFEYENGTSPGPTYRAAGAPWDYYDMAVQQSLSRRRSRS